MLPTDHHDSEFESFLDTLAKNLVWKISKTNVALHTFSALCSRKHTNLLCMARAKLKDIYRKTNRN